MNKIIYYLINDLLRSRALLVYGLCLLFLAVGMFNLNGQQDKALLSLLNITLIAVPLISLVFSTIYFYNSYEFIELLSAQPLKRSKILLSHFLALGLVLSGVFLLGLGLPVILYQAGVLGWWLILIGTLNTLVFISIGGLIFVLTRDKAKGIGFSLLLWLYFSLLFDGIVLLLLYNMSDYPMEKPMLALSLLNPIDLSRLLIILKMEASAMMGFTAAVFREFLGSNLGAWVGIAVLLLWVLLPTVIALRIFNRKDL